MISTTPLRVSTVEPSGIVDSAASGTHVLDPGRFTQTVPLTAPALTLLPDTGAPASDSERLSA